MKHHVYLLNSAIYADFTLGMVLPCVGRRSQVVLIWYVLALYVLRVMCGRVNKMTHVSVFVMFVSIVGVRGALLCACL